MSQGSRQNSRDVFRASAVLKGIFLDLARGFWTSTVSNTQLNSETPSVLLGIPWPALRGPLRNHFWKKSSGISSRKPQPHYGYGPSMSYLALTESGERTQCVPLSLFFVCRRQLTEFFAELTEFATELSDFSLLKQHSAVPKRSCSKRGGRRSTKKSANECKRAQTQVFKRVH